MSETAGGVSTEEAREDGRDTSREEEGEEEVPDLTPDSLITAMDWVEVSSEASDAINNVVDNIIDRMRIERMYEVRRLQHGDRAVSSGMRIEQLEGLFAQDGTAEARHRPPPPRAEGVRDELELLARNRSVGSLLNTRFRTLLENSLHVPQQSTVRSAPRPAAAPEQGGAPAPPPPPAAPLGPVVERREDAMNIGRRAAQEAARSAARARRAAEGTQQQATQQQATLDQAPPMFDYSERQFDYAISDVEELFQRRLVSDVLHSAFRNVLELHIERRLIRSGTQPTPRPNIPGPAATRQFSRDHFPREQYAHQIPPINTPSSSKRLPEMERKLHMMSVEMKEMKSMMKLLVDTQLDVQRSIRQEVNALINNSNITPAKPTKQIKSGSCVICLEQTCDTVMYRCGHFCCCYSCARQLRADGHHCPICRAEVTDILRIYKSTDD